MKPDKRDWFPKNANDHPIFRRIWTENSIRAVRTSRVAEPARRTRKREMPMRIYRVVQTGAKIHDGGVNAGLTRPAYHPGIAGIVTSDPIKPASRHIEIAPIRMPVCFKEKVPILTITRDWGVSHYSDSA
jgi:hypothetical protein